MSLAVDSHIPVEIFCRPAFGRLIDDGSVRLRLQNSYGLISDAQEFSAPLRIPLSMMVPDLNRYLAAVETGRSVRSSSCVSL